VCGQHSQRPSHLSDASTMAKTRVATRVKAVVGGKKSHNQSEDLVKLAEKYHVFVKRLQALIASLKEHYGAMQNIAKTRFKVRRIYAVARTKIQFSAVQCSAVQCSAVQCSAVQCSSGRSCADSLSSK